MTYFAIGESTGGAGERRLGPFETPEEAAQAGRKETKDSNGAFVFRGVVDEANNQVFVDIEPIVSTNSVVRNAVAVKNARLRVGQKVRSLLSGDDGKVGVITEIGNGDCEVKFSDGKIGYVPVEEIEVINSVCTTCPVVANAIAANRRVARNAMTVEQQREFQKTKLPKVEATISAFEKECESIYNQVMSAIKKADGIASTVSQLEKKAEKLNTPYNEPFSVREFDEAKAKELFQRVQKARDKIVACRDAASKVGYDIVNSFRVY